MARARKLFPIYGSSLANNMLTALARGRVVHAFVSSYVDEYDRFALRGGLARDQELAETIGREVVLAMILEVRRVIPGFFGEKQPSKLKEEEREAVKAFFRELVAALGRAWDWEQDDRRQFRRDWRLYSEFSVRQVSTTRAPGRAKPQPEESPFVGRVALLLDPSMLEQARRAARKFLGEVERLAQKLLKQTVRPAA